MEPHEGMPFSLCHTTDGLHIRKLSWPPAGLISEILRLFVRDQHLDRQFEVLGVGKEELAAYRYARLAKPEAILFGADDGHGLVGLLSIRPETWTSVLLGSYSWAFDELVLAEGAPVETAPALLEAALAFLPEPVEFVSARMPSSDLPSIRALNGSGFYTICNQVVAVCPSLRLVPPRVGDCLLMTADDLHHLCGLARKCLHFSPLCLEQSLSPWQINGLLIRSVIDHLEDVNAAVVVVRDGAGREIGFAGVRRIPWSSEYVQRELAVLDLIGVMPGKGEDGREQSIVAHLLDSLACLGIDAVWTEVPMAGPQAPGLLDGLRGSGFTVTSSSQLMHCWLNRGWRGKSLLPEVSLGGMRDLVEASPCYGLGLEGPSLAAGPVPFDRFG